MPFTFIFNGSYFDLEHLFHQLTDFATLDRLRRPQVSGRLLTIQSVKLARRQLEPSQARARRNLTGTITATAYVLPASQGLHRRGERHRRRTGTRRAAGLEHSAPPARRPHPRS